MSSYLGVPFINQVSTTFPKEDFVASDFGSITVSGVTYAAAVELSIDVPGSESANIEVVLDNIRQEPDTAYTVHENSSSQPRILNFSETVPSGAVIYVIHKGVGPYNMTPPAGSIGSTQLASNLQTFTTDTFTGDGSDTTFTLSETPANSNSIMVFVDGILQKVSTNYALANNVVTFTSAPDASADIEIKHMGGLRSHVRRGPDYIYDSFTGNGSATTVTLTNTGVTTNNAFIFYNGICLKPTTDYAINTSTGVVTFTFAPANASEIMVRYQL
jgi:hypothetical protein